MAENIGIKNEKSYSWVQATTCSSIINKTVESWENCDKKYVSSLPGTKNTFTRHWILRVIARTFSVISLNQWKLKKQEAKSYRKWWKYGVNDALTKVECSIWRMNLHHIFIACSFSICARAIHITHCMNYVRATDKKIFARSEANVCAAEAVMYLNKVKLAKKMTHSLKNAIYRRNLRLISFPAHEKTRSCSVHTVRTNMLTTTTHVTFNIHKQNVPFPLLHWYEIGGKGNGAIDCPNITTTTHANGSLPAQNKWGTIRFSGFRPSINHSHRKKLSKQNRLNCAYGHFINSLCVEMVVVV